MPQTLGALLRSASKQLTADSDTPALDAELLLAYTLRRDRLWLATHGQTPATAIQKKRFTKLISQRALGVPIAYLTHQKEFFGRDFYVDKRALVPRPDSEPVIAAVLKELEPQPNPQILEIGTGSGCLAITLALEIPQSQIIATDISKGALKVAARNIHSHKATKRVTLRRQDLLQKEDGQYDLVLANLPYVPHHWITESPHRKNLSHEPWTALHGGKDGLDIVRLFLAQFAAHPCAPLLVLEHGDGQSATIRKMAKKLLPSHNTEVIKDLGKRARGLILFF